MSVSYEGDWSDGKILDFGATGGFFEVFFCDVHAGNVEAAPGELQSMTSRTARYVEDFGFGGELNQGDELFDFFRCALPAVVAEQHLGHVLPE